MAIVDAFLFGWAEVVVLMSAVSIACQACAPVSSQDRRGTVNCATRRVIIS